MKYQLRKERTRHFGILLRPVVEVILHGGVTVKEIFYVDSGADITIIPRSVGELLQLELVENEIIDLSGIGEGKISVAIKSINMEIAGARFKSRIGWALTEKVPLLLGRLDVFDRFRISFEIGHGFLDLQPCSVDSL
jgi:hypothetical protein